MAYRSPREVLAGSTPASIRRLNALDDADAVFEALPLQVMPL